MVIKGEIVDEVTLCSNCAFFKDAKLNTQAPLVWYNFLCTHPDNAIKKTEYVFGETTIHQPECATVNQQGDCKKFALAGAIQ